MLWRLLVLFTVVPFVELSLLLWVADKTNWVMTLTLVVGTAILGGWLARLEGARCWREFHQKLAAGELPADSMLGGLLVLVAGALLITPGLLTDTIGFLLLIPPTRRLILRRLKQYLQARLLPGGAHFEFRYPAADEPDDVLDDGPVTEDEIIDVEFRTRH
ncbi:hypothetical protein JCM19992_28150 [Thermostilla marina]